MPTLAGDVVITRGPDGARQFAVWGVMQDGEQTANPLAYTSRGIGGVSAFSLGRKMTADARRWGDLLAESRHPHLDKAAMTGPMPTRDGNVVIALRERSALDVWIVATEASNGLGRTVTPARPWAARPR